MPRIVFCEKHTEMEADEIHLWVSNNLGTVSPSLTSAEKKRALEYRDEKERAFFVFRHSLLHELLQNYGDVYFSSSSSGNYSAFAFTKIGKIGVDVEEIRPLIGMEEVVEDYCSEEEKRYIGRGDRLERFFDIWTRKEAILKAVGSGFVGDLKKVDSMVPWVYPIKKYKNLGLAVAIQGKK